MRRTQIYIDDSIYTFLKSEGMKKKKTISDIIRETIREKMERKVDTLLKTTEEAFGLWRDKKFDVDAYVRKSRKDRQI
jgi:hypothetical protein